MFYFFCCVFICFSLFFIFPNFFLFPQCVLFLFHFNTLSNIKHVLLLCFSHTFFNLMMLNQNTNNQSYFWQKLFIDWNFSSLIFFSLKQISWFLFSWFLSFFVSFFSSAAKEVPIKFQSFSAKMDNSIDRSAICYNFTIGNEKLGEFFSPNYPNNYPNSSECERVIKGKGKWVPVKADQTPFKLMLSES